MFKSNSTDATRGAVGIGTLIIFIAFVLVAAIAAVTVVDTADILQSTAQQTGSEATAQVSNQIVVNSVSGTVDNETVDAVNMNIMASAGADDIDMSQATIEFIGSNGQAVLVYDDAGPVAGTSFNVDAYKDDDTSMPVINQRSDRANLSLTFDSAGADAELPLPEGDDVTLRIQTASGSTSTVTFQVPETLDSKDGQSIFLK
jgi:flagellin-like protein